MTIAEFDLKRVQPIAVPNRSERGGFYWCPSETRPDRSDGSISCLKRGEAEQRNGNETKPSRLHSASVLAGGVSRRGSSAIGFAIEGLIKSTEVRISRSAK